MMKTTRILLIAGALLGLAAAASAQNQVTANAGSADKSSTLDLIQVEYGATGAFADVTAEVKTLLQKGATAIEVSNRNFGDPAPKQSKRMIITLRHRGNPLTLRGNEGTTLDLSDQRLATLARHALKAASYRGPFEIRKAEYGSGNRVIDVTETVKALLADGGSRIDINNENFGDPLHGIKKKLTVTVRYQDETRQIEGHEATILDLSQKIPAMSH